MRFKIRYKSLAYVTGILLLLLVYAYRKSGNGNGGRPQVLIVSYFRSGTTLLADLLHLQSDTFLHFEPLFMLTEYESVDGPAEVERALGLLFSLLRCDFRSLSRWVTDHRQVWLYHYYSKNQGLEWPEQAFRLPLDVQTRTLSRACRRRSVALLKVVRLRLRHASRLLETFPDLRVLHLTRDPRGMLASRLERGWCRDTPSCIRPGLFCQHLREDLKAAPDLRRRFPGRFLSLNYEDLVLDLQRQTGRIFAFLGWDYETNRKSIEQFVASHAEATVNVTDNPYNTFRRDSKGRAYAWKNNLPANHTLSVEKECKDVILLRKKSFSDE